MEWRAVADGFNEKLHFPNCIGALDGKHIVLGAPPNPSSPFYNYKGIIILIWNFRHTHFKLPIILGFQSIIMLGIADADHKFIYIDVGRNGRTPKADGDELSQCPLGQALDSQQLCLPPPDALGGRHIPVPYVFVANDAFAMRPNIIKPFPDARNLAGQQQSDYNSRLSSVQQTIDNAYGHMAARFRIIRSPVRLEPEKAKKVGLACCVLHNYLISTNRQRYAPPGSFDQYDENGCATALGEWRSQEVNHTLIPLEAVREEGAMWWDNEVQSEFTSFFAAADAVKQESRN